MTFEVGVNFPWAHCGHDFGPRPPAWAGAAPTDWAAIERELRSLAQDGMRIVRWWILAGGVNYPCGADPLNVAERRGEQLILRSAPPALPAAFVLDFEALLAACARAGVRLLPSLTSFELFLPIAEQRGGVLSRGRASWVLGESLEPFLDAVLEPLLDACARAPSSLYAFEVINEPDWLVKGRADPYALSCFVEQACRRIADRNLRATVGTLRASASWLTPGARRTLSRLAERGAYVHQAHHYPSDERPTLPAASASPLGPCLLGELPTARASGRGAFRELGATEGDTERYLEARLALAMERGYEGALVWAHRARDEHAELREPQRAQIRRYTSKLAV